MNKIILGNTFDVMKDLIKQGVKVNSIITSPPYWQLRKYDIPDCIIGGKDNCEHDFNKVSEYNLSNNNGTGTGSVSQKPNVNVNVNVCTKCGAFYGQLGLEPTYQMFLEHLWLFMDLCYELLAEDGTCFINLGDTYGGSSCGTSYDTACVGKTGIQTNVNKWPGKGHTRGGTDKCLLLIPHRFAIGCESPKYVLRDDLTDEEKEYVFEELKKYGKE